MNDTAAVFPTTWRRAAQDATLTVLAMVVAAAAAAWLDPGPASAVLGAVLALSRERSHLAVHRRGRLEALAALPLLSLAALGLGALLHHWPWVGAGVFVVVLAASVWMRGFGPLARRASRLVALPMAALLVVPPLPHDARWSGWLAPILPVLVALLALAGVTLARRVGHWLGWRTAGAAPEAAEAPRAAAPDRLGLSAPARLALQMAVALAGAFVLGLVVFPDHWRWLVLTAFLVNSGSLGGSDVLRKSVLRVLGATGGTVLAMAFAGHAGTDAMGVAALAIACVFAGVFLRAVGYGWWVLCVTLALALLQGLAPAGVPLLLWQRVLEIVLGALIGVAAALLVFPISSTDILRRRLAQALAAMADALDPAAGDRATGLVAAGIGRVRAMRPALRAHSLLARPTHPQPLAWIDTLVACEAPLAALVARGVRPATVRQAIGAARKAMREPAAIGAALAALREALAAA